MNKKQQMQTNPVIGITTYSRDSQGNFYLPSQYVEAVRKAGGIPVLLTPGEMRIQQLLTLLDGIILAGGGDIAPELYGSPGHETIARVDHERDEFELRLAQQLFSFSLPVLGICRGSQLLNVASGGTLVEHLPAAFGSQVAHRCDDGREIAHAVAIQPASRLARIVGAERIMVMSKHHQANDKMPEIWRIVARTADGVIEAMEHKTHPWMFGVLWHPELSPDDPYQMRLFKALVEAAGNRKRVSLGA